MYKVFVDHKPIVIITRDKKSEMHPALDFVDQMHFVTDVKPYLKGINLDNPLQILCDDVELAFKDLFRDYKKIRAAGGIVRRKEKYLIMKRNGKWDIPKGKIDKGEKKKDAAVREIEEECGIIGPIINEFLVTTYHVFNNKGRKAIKKTFWYLLEYDGPKVTTPQLEEGITKVKWVDYDGIMKIRSNTYGSVNEVLDAFEKVVK